jgi:hypothetical protein
MLESVETLKLYPGYDQFVLDDMKVIIGRIPEEAFIEAIINMQPYKPQFTTAIYRSSQQQQKRKFNFSQKFSISAKTEIGTVASTIDST